MRNCLLLVGVNIIYFLRAKTEERHLSRDPAYVEYSNWIESNGLYAILRRSGFQLWQKNLGRSLALRPQHWIGIFGVGLIQRIADAIAGGYSLLPFTPLPKSSPLGLSPALPTALSFPGLPPLLLGTAAVTGTAAVGTAAVTGTAAVGTAAVTGTAAVGTAAVTGTAAVGTAAVTGTAAVGTAAVTGTAATGTAAYWSCCLNCRCLSCCYWSCCCQFHCHHCYLPQDLRSTPGRCRPYRHSGTISRNPGAPFVYPSAVPFHRRIQLC